MPLPSSFALPSFALPAARLAARAAIAALCALAATGATAQGFPGTQEEHARAELVAATDAAVPGQPLSLGVKIVHDPHWHTYWRVPGDSGLPTTLAWTLPPGYSAGPIEWPHPQRLPTGPLMNFGYENTLLLPVTVQVPADAVPGTRVPLKVRADWLVCKDVCIPGGADLSLTLPVKAQAVPSREAPLFASTRALVPQQTLQGQARLDGTRMRLALPAGPGGQPPQRVEFFPLEDARLEPAARQVLKAEADGAALYLTAMEPVEADFRTLQGVLVADGGPAAGGWVANVTAPLTAAPVAVVEGAGVAPAPVHGGAASSAGAAGSGSALTLAAALALAFVGGLILNLMPCVFPVLSLKVIGLAQHRHGHGSLAAHGLAFAVGVVLSFVLLAALLIGLQRAGGALGWGFQLQTPWVVGGLTLLFFAIGLNLLGVFDVSLGTGLANSRAAERLAAAPRWQGSLGTGVLAVIVASPCTAPFMGAALGFAVTQPAPVALAVFAALGVGMATPYVLLTLFPQALARLPRPGAWMELFKQFMAFPMFATCVWLLWVLAQQVEVGAVTLVLGSLVLLGFALWALGLAQRGRGHFRWAAAMGLLLAAASFFPVTSSGSAQAARAAAAAGWTEFSPEALAQLRSAGTPVFVDFTAAWCVTCQVNKRVAIETDKVRARTQELGVVKMRADWTNRDERITRALAEFGRNGVPLYVLYDRQGQPQVLPELLTEGMVLAALERAAPRP